MSIDSRPIEMSMTEAERLQRVERMVKALREGKSDDFDMVAVIEALAKFSSETPKGGNGWASKLIYALLVSFILGGVVLYGKVSALEAQVEQCEKKP